MLATGQTERAIAAFDQVIARGGAGDQYSYLFRGRAQMAKGDIDAAMIDFDRALAISPSSTDALLARGMAWTRKRNFESALKDLDQALSKDERVESYLARGRVYEEQGNAERAMADFRRATELPPKNVFDVIAQVDAKKRMDEINKRVPCGTARANGTDTCL